MRRWALPKAPTSWAPDCACVLSSAHEHLLSPVSYNPNPLSKSSLLGLPRSRCHKQVKSDERESKECED